MKINLAIKKFIKKLAEERFQEEVVLPGMWQINADMDGYEDDIYAYKNHWIKDKSDEYKEDLIKIIENKSEESNA